MSIMNQHRETIATYDQSAQQLAEYFAGVGARTADIDRGLELAGAGPDARVVEMGCGDGRDAAEIVKRVGWYQGVDPSEGLLKIARQRLPQASFVKADALSYQYPQDLDAIFAFASLLHVDKDDFRVAAEHASLALRGGGVLYLSLKERPEYQAELKKDHFGERMFYFYNPQVITKLIGSLLTPVYEDHQTIGHTTWFTMALRKDS